MCYTGVTEGKIEKEGKMSFWNLYFHLHNTLSLPEGVQKKLKTLALIGTQQSVTEICIGEREK